MAFIQANVNYANQYSRDLANAYPYLSYFADLWAGSNASKYRPVNGKSVLIPSLEVSGARAANRDQITGTFNRNWNNEWQTVTMSMDREWDTLIDPLDIVETNDVATIANVTKTFNEFQKVPEMDTYAASHLYGFANTAGNVDSTVLAANNILETWDGYLTDMTNARINRDRLRCKMTPNAYKLLKEAAGITRFIDAGTGVRNVDRNVGKLDGVLIEEVPADMMRTKYSYTEGFQSTDDAQQIHILLYDPESLIAPVVYDTSMVSAPSAQTKGKYVYYERYYYDVFQLSKRTQGVIANVSSTVISL